MYWKFLLQKLHLFIETVFFDVIKDRENQKINELQQKHEKDSSNLIEEMNNKFTQLLSMIQQNPLLTNVKLEVLEKILTR